MCTIRERTNSFAVLCNWIRELSNSIREPSDSIKVFSYTTNTSEIWKNVGIKELSDSFTELCNWIGSSVIELESSAIQ